MITTENQTIENQESTTPEEEISQLKEKEQLLTTPIAGFWRRVLAFLIDIFILGIVLITIGFLFRDLAFSLGPWGRIFGYAIIIPYWGWFNSYEQQGQTLGKKAMKITVVNRDGRYLSLSQSFLRATLLSAVFILNGWAIPILQTPIVAIIVAVILYCGSFIMFYGLVFNKTTRQGLHDLLAQTYVVRTSFDKTMPLPFLPTRHKKVTYGIMAVIALLTIGGGIWGQFNTPAIILEPEEWEEIRELQADLQQDSRFFAVGVKRLNRTSLQGGKTLRDLNIELWAKTSCASNQAICREMITEVARQALAEYDNIEELSGMTITAYNRFDLGLANGNWAVGNSQTIEDWQLELNE